MPTTSRWKGEKMIAEHEAANRELDLPTRTASASAPRSTDKDYAGLWQQSLATSASLLAVAADKAMRNRLIRLLFERSTWMTVSSHLNYSFSASNLRSIALAIRSEKLETDLLNYHVSYLNRASFRVLVREVLVNGEYMFDAGHDAPVILDCGANIGLATLFFKTIYPRARIFAFEADPTTATVLRKNVEQNNLENVSVHNVLLTDRDGKLPFYVEEDREGSLMMSANCRRLSNSREIMVQAGKLSDYIDCQIDLLKLDVEGSEFGVLTDLVRSGKISHIHRMAIEYHHKIGGQASCFARFLQLLEDTGFEYQLSVEHHDSCKEGFFQDVLVRAYRPTLPIPNVAV
jgi:FkbM family methyltransferase